MAELQEISLQARVLARDQLPDDIVGAVVFLASAGAGFLIRQIPAFSLAKAVLVYKGLLIAFL